MENSMVKKIHDYGQSIWLDFIDRKLMDSGNLQSLIDDDGVRGVTSNPAIFEKAISNSDDYDADIEKFASQGMDDEAIFYAMAVNDIQRATDILLPVYEEKVEAADGFVSLEVSPRFARDTAQTTAQAMELWKAVNRKNVMIKIPGTAEGLQAIRTSISEGININVTLLFGLQRYREVTEAYIAGLEDRVAAGKPIDSVASVASFFLSRIDILIDPLLNKMGMEEIAGYTAIALAKQAYQIYKEVFSSDRFKALKEKGGTPQRLLWASTSNKNPKFKATRYVEELIGPNTVNTIPLETLEAFRAEGFAASTLETGLDNVNQTLVEISNAGIDLEEIAQELEDQGIEKFKEPYGKMLAAIGQQREMAKK